MLPDTTIYDRLTAELGATVDTIVAVKLDDGYTVGALPAVVVQLISDVPAVVALEGTLLRDECRYQVSIYGTDLASVRSVRDAVKTALHDYKTGTLYSRYDNSYELYESGDAVYHIPVDFIVSF